jgi:hypothetical protein
MGPMVGSMSMEGELRKWFKELLEDANESMYLDGYAEPDGKPRHPHLTFTGWVMLQFWWDVRWRCTLLVCRLFDHDWEDDSYGGPDSGCMAMHCKRCGFSWHHTLY